MANWGANNQNTRENTRGSSAFIGGPGPTDGGAIMDVFAHLSGWAGAESSRCAVYQGGVAGDPTGATLIVDFGQVTTDIPATWAWYGQVANFGKTASGTLAANTYTWIMFKLTDTNIGLNNTQKGNLEASSERFLTTSEATNVAFPSTWGSDAGQAPAEVSMAYITYTPAAAPSGSYDKRGFGRGILRGIR